MAFLLYAAACAAAAFVYSAASVAAAVVLAPVPPLSFCFVPPLHIFFYKNPKFISS